MIHPDGGNPYSSTIETPPRTSYGLVTWRHRFDTISSTSEKPPRTAHGLVTRRYNFETTAGRCGCCNSISRAAASHLVTLCEGTLSGVCTTRPILAQGPKRRAPLHHHHQGHQCGRRVCLVYLYLREYPRVQLYLYFSLGMFRRVYDIEHIRNYIHARLHTQHKTNTSHLCTVMYMDVYIHF
jgi:hypothetical protein